MTLLQNWLSLSSAVKLCNRAIFNKITKRPPDNSSQSPSSNMYRSQKYFSSQARYWWQ